MLALYETIEEPGLIRAAEHLCVAARTAPKVNGKDVLVTAMVTGDEKNQLQQQMRIIGERDAIPFFLSDAGNLVHAPVVVLIGTRKEPLQLPA